MTTKAAPAEISARLRGIIVVDARGFRTVYEFIDGGQHLTNDAYEVDQDVPADDIPAKACYAVVEDLDVDSYENLHWSDQPVPLRFVGSPDEIGRS